MNQHERALVKKLREKLADKFDKIHIELISKLPINRFWQHFWYSPIPADSHLELKFAERKCQKQFGNKLIHKKPSASEPFRDYIKDQLG